MTTLWEKWEAGLDAQRESIRKRLVRAKLAHRADAILAACRVSAGMRFQLLETKPAPKGTSRAGGLPDLPLDATWPEDHAFLLQINLADVASIALTPPLPKKGILSFFVVDGNDGDGDHLSEGHVIFTPASAPLVRTKRPEDELTKFPTRAIEFVPFLSLPQSNHASITKIGLTAEESDRYADDVYRERPEPRYRLGGHESDYYAPASVRDELLLLSLSSSDAMSFFWGDNDNLHFSLPESDWKRGDFTKAHPRCATA